ncbi:hypothetical protein [Pseudoscardovia suis]
MGETDFIMIGGRKWLDSEHAAAMLGISPASLTSNRNRCYVLQDLDCMVWHRVLLWDFYDVCAECERRYPADKGYLHQIS